MPAKKSPSGSTAVYARTARSNEHALAWQIGRCRAHCLSQGWTTITQYADDGCSGMRLSDRAELARLLDDARAGLVARVVVEDLSRLARPPDLQAWLVKKLRSCGVALYVVEDNLPRTAH